MAEQVLLSVKKEASEEGEQKKSSLPLLSLLTFLPVGNPLNGMSLLQRHFFFESLLRMLHLQGVEQRKRNELLSPKLLPPNMIAGVTIPKVDPVSVQAMLEMEKWKERTSEKEAIDLQEQNAKGRLPLDGKLVIAQGIQSQKQTILPPDQYSSDSAASAPSSQAQLQRAGARGSKEMRNAAPAAQGASAQKSQQPPALLPREARNTNTLYSMVFGAGYKEVRKSQENLAIVLDDYARGKDELAVGAISDFQGRLETENYKSDDLMATLLLVIEDRIWSSEEAGVSGTPPTGSSVRAGVHVPQRMRDSMRESAEVRLASVREMLRYYFEHNPEDYNAALAAALGITADQEGDALFLQDRLASELASIGSFAIAQKMLAEIKRKNKMDVKKCLMELGYRYDRKSKKLILGKRTCVKSFGARGILGMLLSAARKSKS